MLHVMQSPRPQPPTRRPPPRPKPVVPAVAQPAAVATVRRHTFRIPDVREIPRRTVAGPWEAGW
jgi:hypothetical protein